MTKVEPTVVRIPWAAPLPSVGTQLDTTHGSGVVVGTGGKDRWKLFVDLRIDVPVGQDQERDGGEAPAESVAPFVPLSQPPVMWRRVDFDMEPEPARPVHFGLDGRDTRTAVVDWLRKAEKATWPAWWMVPEAEHARLLAVAAAARALRVKAQYLSYTDPLLAELGALAVAVDALDSADGGVSKCPGTHEAPREDDAILAVVTAARQWRAQVDSPSRVLRADSHHALVAAVDALPPQAPRAERDGRGVPASDRVVFKGLFRKGEDTVQVGHGVGAVAISMNAHGTQAAIMLHPAEADALSRALIRQAQAARGLARGGIVSDPPRPFLIAEQGPEEVSDVT